ncbi:MAG TPA: ribonuclease HI [Clostridiales bacterium]|nr:ribonuclease HI [Clostridiales bacterium]
MAGALTKVTIYTDGACSGNPGPGGWGAILMASGHKKEISGGEKLTTNNRMELMAVIMALEALNRPCEVDLYSDSAYVVNAFNQHWIDNWQKNGWKNSAKAEVANTDLWMKLLKLTATHRVNFIKVKGHADNEFNNRCDELAVAQSVRYSSEEGL